MYGASGQRELGEVLPPLQSQPPPEAPALKIQPQALSGAADTEAHIINASDQLSRDGSGLDVITDLLAQAAERSKQKDALYNSITDDFAEAERVRSALRESEEERSSLLETVETLRVALAELERTRSRERALAAEEVHGARAKLEESEAIRSREAALARHSSGGRQVLEKALTEAQAETQRLQTALEVEQARTASAEGQRLQALGELEKERAERVAEAARLKEGGAAALAQEKALASGARMKKKKLEEDVARLEAELEAERARADTAERVAASAAADAAGASQRASLAQQHASGNAQEALSREAAARKQAEARSEGLERKLKEALQACERAKAECERVATRNDQLEDELLALKGGGKYGVEDLVAQLDDMESMLDPAKAREAERRLRERAKRANASEVEARLS